MLEPRRYQCHRFTKPIQIDGSMNDSQWAGLLWTKDFVDVTEDDKLRPYFRRRMKMAWDDHFFYFAAELMEPHVWGTITEKNAVNIHLPDRWGEVVFIK